MPRPVHFEILIDNPDRAIKFFEEVFDWKFQRWNMPGPQNYWLVTTGEKGEPGINGGLMSRSVFPAPVNAIQILGVSSVDEYLEKVTQHGGEILQPKMPVPGVGYAAYCRDTEGNVFGMFQSDPAAK